MFAAYEQMPIDNGIDVKAAPAIAVLAGGAKRVAKGLALAQSHQKLVVIGGKEGTSRRAMINAVGIKPSNISSISIILKYLVSLTTRAVMGWSLLNGSSRIQLIRK